MSDRQSPQSFDFAAGESFGLSFDTDDVISGMDVQFTARRKPGSTVVLESGVGTVVAAVAAAQQCTVTVQDEDTDSLIGTYRYSLEIEDGAGAKSEVAWGYLTFKPSMV